MATHSRILTWRILWMEEPGRHGVAKSQTRLSTQMEPIAPASAGAVSPLCLYIYVHVIAFLMGLGYVSLSNPQSAAGGSDGPPRRLSCSCGGLGVAGTWVGVAVSSKCQGPFAPCGLFMWPPAGWPHFSCGSLQSQVREWGWELMSSERVGPEGPCPSALCWLNVGPCPASMSCRERLQGCDAWKSAPLRSHGQQASIDGLGE